MGAGFHGGFGDTHGAVVAAIADSTLVGNGRGFQLKDAAKRVPHEEGFTDVAVHGAPHHIAVYVNKDGIDREVILNHRSLASFLRKDSGYKGGNIRLLSCSTGSPMGTFAQNLANKMGVTVRAPSDKLFIFPNGRTVIGPDVHHNTGRWIDYHPQKGKGK